MVPGTLELHMGARPNAGQRVIAPRHNPSGVPLSGC
jgi:hypothetical protein